MTALEYWLYLKLNTLVNIPIDVLEALDIRQTAQMEQLDIMRKVK